VHFGPRAQPQKYIFPIFTGLISYRMLQFLKALSQELFIFGNDLKIMQYSPRDPIFFPRFFHQKIRSSKFPRKKNGPSSRSEFNTKFDNHNMFVNIYALTFFLVLKI